MQYLVVFLLLLCGCQTTRDAPQSVDESQKLPTAPPDSLILPSRHFVTVYNPNKNIAYYSAYVLRAENLRMPKIERRDLFHPDPHLKPKGATAVRPEGYFKTGYDKGHLAPSADFIWDREANRDTFVMSNIVPQRPKLNRIAWSSLERAVRSWACKEDVIRVVTGPILSDDGTYLPGRPVPIPAKFFKVVFDETPPKKTIAFILTQKDGEADAYKTSVVSLQQVEKETNISFLPREIASSEVDTDYNSSLSRWVGDSCHLISGPDKVTPIAPIAIGNKR